MKIVILERNSVGADVSMAPIKAFGDVTEYTDTTPETVAERIADADIVIANKLPLNESTLKDAANVKIICEFATGYDNIDTEYCKNRGIAVCNVSGYSTEAVVQHTFALCFYLLEHLPYYDEYVKSGAYSAQPLFTNYSKHFTELSGKTWGIVGMGTIGRRVAEVARAFGCTFASATLSSAASGSGVSAAVSGSTVPISATVCAASSGCFVSAASPCSMASSFSSIFFKLPVCFSALLLKTMIATSTSTAITISVISIAGSVPVPI